MGRPRASKDGRGGAGKAVHGNAPGLLGSPNTPSHTVNSPAVKNISVCFHEIDRTFNQSPFVYTVSLKARDNKEIILLKE